MANNPTPLILGKNESYIKNDAGVWVDTKTKKPVTTEFSKMLDQVSAQMEKDSPAQTNTPSSTSSAPSSTVAGKAKTDSAPKAPTTPNLQTKEMQNTFKSLIQTMKNLNKTITNLNDTLDTTVGTASQPEQAKSKETEFTAPTEKMTFGERLKASAKERIAKQGTIGESFIKNYQELRGKPEIVKDEASGKYFNTKTKKEHSEKDYLAEQERYKNRPSRMEAFASAGTKGLGQGLKTVAEGADITGIYARSNEMKKEQENAKKEESRIQGLKEETTSKTTDAKPAPSGPSGPSGGKGKDVSIVNISDSVVTKLADAIAEKLGSLMPKGETAPQTRDERGRFVKKSEQSTAQAEPVARQPTQVAEATPVTSEQSTAQAEPSTASREQPTAAPEPAAQEKEQPKAAQRRDARGRFVKKDAEPVVSAAEEKAQSPLQKAFSNRKQPRGPGGRFAKKQEPLLGKKGQELLSKITGGKSEGVISKVLGKDAGSKFAGKSSGGIVSKFMQKEGSSVLSKFAGKELGQVGGRGLARVAQRGLLKVGGKGLAKIAGKAVGKSLLKKIPVIGALVGGALAIGRLMKGDIVGAGMEAASGLASTVPGVGTAASVGIDVALAAKDAMSAPQEDVPPDAVPAGGETSQPDMKSALGSAFDKGGVRKFADGGIVDKPTLFGYGEGKKGLMGEAGAEAIMPLKRGPSGKLGIEQVKAPDFDKKTTDLANNTGNNTKMKEKAGKGDNGSPTVTSISTTNVNNNNENNAINMPTAGPRGSLNIAYYA